MFSLLLPIIYLSFISLGLPDGLLGAAWPSMYPAFGVPVSASGSVFMTISCGTILSSLLSDRLNSRFGTARVTAVSVALTSMALFGFSFCGTFPMLYLWAVPYGLGAGGVDAALNNYVALHYESKHMSWLHCMWGLGATVGPYIMQTVLEGGGIWNTGYRIVGFIQVALVAVLVLSQPIWKTGIRQEASAEPRKPLSMKEIFAIPGAKEVMLTFFGYCALEQTAGLWTASYLVLGLDVDPVTAAGFAGLFYLGITLGRFLNGFIAMRLSDDTMIFMGLGIIGIGIGLILIPVGQIFALTGFVVVGLGCAPVYPCIIHSTPVHFGAENSQALVGVQMASAYVGSCVMPPVFGLLAEKVNIRLLPWFLLGLLLVMVVEYRRMVKTTVN